MPEKIVGGAKRVSYHFPKEAVAQLNAIKHRTYFESGAEIIRFSLQIYEELLHLVQSGFSLFVMDTAGGESEYSIFKRFLHPIMDGGLGVDPKLLDDPVPESFFFSGEAVKRIEGIKNKIYLKNNSDVIRICLTTYSDFLIINDKGGKLFIKINGIKSLEYNIFAPNGKEILLSAQDKMLS